MSMSVFSASSFVALPVINGALFPEFDTFFLLLHEPKNAIAIKLIMTQWILLIFMMWYIIYKCMTNDAGRKKLRSLTRNSILLRIGIINETINKLTCLKNCEQKENYCYWGWHSWIKCRILSC
jgi:hypothetical protein